MARVRLLNVSKSFFGRRGPWAVRDLSLNIEDGELIVFVGPSGCGKSTTLRMLAGLDDTTVGRIMIGGRDVTTLPPKDRNVAMVFQNYALYPQKTVYSNMAFGLRVRGEARDEINRRVHAAAVSLGLEPLLDRKPRQLSGGQRQRVALGRALVRDPDVFLLDEPLSNLDAKLRVKMREEIATLHERLGATMVFVTHDQVEAMTLGDRIVIMRDGSVQQVGRPLDLYDRPENTFVAAFIGSPEMNLFEGQLVREADQLKVRVDELLISVPQGVFSETEKSVVIGIRPEHIALAGGTSPFELIVSLVEQVGAQTYVIGTVAGYKMRATFVRKDGIAAGDKLAITLPEDRLSLFSLESGRTLRLTKTISNNKQGNVGDHEQEKLPTVQD